MADILWDEKLVFMHYPKCGTRNMRSILDQISQINNTLLVSSMNEDYLLFSKGGHKKKIFVEPTTKTWRHNFLLDSLY